MIANFETNVEHRTSNFEGRSEEGRPFESLHLKQRGTSGTEGTWRGLVSFLGGGGKEAHALRVVSPEQWAAEGVVGGVVGVDFETYYTAEYSVKALGTWAYCADSRFDAYLVAVADSVKVCVCRPEDFPWESIAGLEWVSHNREFDRHVWEALTEALRHKWEGIYHGLTRMNTDAFGVGPSHWWCSAGVCAFLQLPRDLAGAVDEVFGVRLDKGVRSKAAGKFSRRHRGTGDLFREEADEEMLVYAAKDAVACLALWLRLGETWPERERRLFEVSCEMGRRGLAMDWGYVEASRVELIGQVEGLKASLPWVPSLSIPKFKAACEAVGVPAPESTKVDDPGFLEWAETYRDTPAGEWARTLQAVRSANRTEKVLASMLARRCRAAGGREQGAGENGKTNVEHPTLIFERPTGRPLVPSRCGDRRSREETVDRMIYELKYCGATTGRWSGGGGLNLQNLNRSEAEGVDLRRAITAAPGYVLAAVDFAQIEARVLLYLAGDHEALRILMEEVEADLYEIHARRTMGFGAAEPRGDGGQRVEVRGQGEETLKEYCARTGSTLRQLAKARVLGLGFGCGAVKFVAVAKSMAGLEITLAESERIVGEYRESNPLVVGLWRRLEDTARAKVGGDYVLPLPCTGADRSYGRFLIYRDLRRRGRELVCRVGGQETKLYGGLLAENWTQATARDVLADAWLRCVDAGFCPVLSVHDELVFELPEVTAEADLARIVEIMEAPVPWAPGLPLKAEGTLMNFYKK